MPRQSPGIETTSSLTPDAAAPARLRPALKTGAAELALAAAGVAAVAAAYAHPLRTRPNYDEEVYLATMRELRHGVAIGDVFLSQPPGFGWFLDAVGVVAGTLESVRGVMIGVAILGCIGAFVIGRRAGGTLGGAVAAGTLAVAPAWAVNASRVEAEVPSTTLAIAALGLAPRFPALAGIAFAVAVSVKLLAVSALVPLVLLARRDLKRLVLGAAGAAAVVTLSVAPHLGQVWSQAIVFHVNGRKVASPLRDNLRPIVHFFDLGTPFAVLTAAGVVTAVVLLVRHVRIEWALWTWPVFASVVLVAQRPLIYHHLVVLAAAWALPVGATLAAGSARLDTGPRRAAAVVLGLAVAVGLTQQWRRNPPISPIPDVDAAAARLRTLVPPGSIVATDRQIVAFQAGYLEPPQLVDLSFVRLQSGELTRRRLLQESAGARAFVVGRGLRDDRQLLAALARRYPMRVTVGSIIIFARSAQ